MSDPYVVPAVHDDGRRILVGPVHSRESASRLSAEIARLGWHPGEPVSHMTRAAWFTMAYTERKGAIDREKPPSGDHQPAGSPLLSEAGSELDRAIEREKAR